MADKRTVPPEAAAFLQEFRQWAIGDDYEREEAVDTASHADLQRLVDAHDALPPSFWDWLGAPPPPEETPQEYYDVSDVIRAAESATAVLDPPQFTPENLPSVDQMRAEFERLFRDYPGSS